MGLTCRWQASTTKYHSAIINSSIFREARQELLTCTWPVMPASCRCVCQVPFIISRSATEKEMGKQYIWQRHGAWQGTLLVGLVGSGRHNGGYTCERFGWATNVAMLDFGPGVYLAGIPSMALGRDMVYPLALPGLASLVQGPC